MKKVPVVIAICLFALPVTGYADENCRLPFRSGENPDAGTVPIWEPIEITGTIDYTIEEKDGQPYIRLPVIEKEGILYKLHLPIPFLKEQNIRSGQMITVTGKGRPSAWSKDRSVSVIVLSVESDGIKKTVPWPSRTERKDSIKQRL
ncbi:MAG: hypothetical protein SOZ27_00380 [Spirochaetia bacterium]|nr:hypothetical protein [Spirochaetia bacterium]